MRRHGKTLTSTYLLVGNRSANFRLDITLILTLKRNVYVSVYLFSVTCGVACQNGGKCVGGDACECPRGVYGDLCQYRTGAREPSPLLTK